MINAYVKHSDVELVEILKRSKQDNNTRVSEDTFGELYRRYSAKILAYCRGLINDRSQSDDIFQEAFIKFYNSIDCNFSAANVGGYLFRIARNLSFNYLRDRKKTVSIEEFDFITDTVADYENKELFDLVMKGIDLLDEKYKEAFVLSKLDGLSAQEIAEICDITPEGAKTRIKRARVKLIEILEPYLKDIYK